jgi:hypothetical protein
LPFSSPAQPSLPLRCSAYRLAHIVEVYQHLSFPYMRYGACMHARAAMQQALLEISASLAMPAASGLCAQDGAGSLKQSSMCMHA